MNPFDEPPINPDDTSPSIAVRPVEFDERVRQQQRAGGGWRGPLGLLSLLGALAFTLGTVALLLIPTSAPTPAPHPTIEEPTQAVINTEPTQAGVIEATEPIVVEAPQTVNDGLPPIVEPQALSGLLDSPVDNSSNAVIENLYNPFTIVPSDRPRSEFLEYTAQRGDTLVEIAERYNLEPETLAWCNDRRIVYVLRPGDVLRVAPVDGACHRVLGTREETVRSLAEDYSIEDVFSIIDSTYNPAIYGISPDDLLPGGLNIFIPGGQGTEITWSPGYETATDASGNLLTVSFASGQSGSCGSVSPGGGSAWTNPLPNGRWSRGFFPGHSGIDLSASTGTPIFAANSGPVLFSGFSNWGYGNTVVLSHGQYSTLYAHMSSRSVGCGGFVGAGQVVGLVGSTGNSTGPHLHFEIRLNDEPVNPSGFGVGW